MIRDSSFTCNTRFLHDAYPSARRWMMAYNFPQAIDSFHAGDLVPLYMNNISDAIAMISQYASKQLFPTQISALATAVAHKIQPTYQAYLAAFAANGDPNSIITSSRTIAAAATTTVISAPSWTTASPGPTLGNVMAASNHGWDANEQDDQNTEAICAFWQTIAAELMQVRSLSEARGGTEGAGGKEEL